MDIVTKFSKQVKSLRLKRRMSQGDLARKLGVHPTYISKIERGEQNISIKGLAELAGALSVDPRELL